MNFDCVFKGDSFDEIYREVLNGVAGYGIVSEPRGQKIFELLKTTIILTNPRNRILSSKVRKHSYAYAVGEFLWYWRGSNLLKDVSYYVPSLEKYSNDGETLNSAYGYRLMGVGLSYPHQLVNIVNKLIDDKDSRQAVATIYDPVDISYKNKDVPCTLSLQFLIRNNELIMIVNMRSNDAFMGLIYDVYSFTMLHEFIYNKLVKYYSGLKLGSYIHNSASTHLYVNDEKKIFDVLREKANEKAQKPFFNKEINDLDLVEKNLRISGESNIVIDEGYSKTAQWMYEKLVNFNKRKNASNSRF